MKSKTIKALTAGVVAIGTITVADAQGFDSGKDDYNSHCAACHGASGEGEGTYGRFLNVIVPNLTTLSKRNGGVFPASKVYEAINGTLDLPAHGTRNMPIWGQDFIYKTSPRNPRPEAFVRAKINALVVYIRRLQVN